MASNLTMCGFTKTPGLVEILSSIYSPPVGANGPCTSLSFFQTLRPALRTQDSSLTNELRASDGHIHI